MLHNLVLHACRDKHVTNLIDNIYKSIIVSFFFNKPDRIEASHACTTKKKIIITKNEPKSENSK